MNMVWVGRVVKVQGIRGEVRIFFSEGGIETFSKGIRVYVGDARGNRQTFTIENSRIQGRLTIVSFAEINTREDAQALVGGEVYVAEGSLPLLPPDEYYWHQLKGLRVKTDTGDEFGVLEEIIPTGSNDVFVVRRGEQELLIPATEEVIQKVDLEQRIMTIHLLEGLLSNDDL